MNFLEFQWIDDQPTLKEALKGLLNCSGQLLKKHYSSKELSRSVRSRDVSKLPIDLVNHMLINPVYTGPEAQVLGDRGDYLVLHKPPGVHSHPLIYSDTDTLLNFLALSEKWQALEVNSSQYDRGLLYRLDYETSGIMLVSQNQKYFEEIRLQFKQKMKRKLYWAIVEGEFDKEGEWTHYFRGTGAKGSKQKVDSHPHPEADEGKLSVRKVSFTEGKSLLLVDLGSGLRHQIRAQLAALGYPILGDELYGGRKAERLFLHALRYEWDERVEEDPNAELFDLFLDLDSALQMTHDMLRTLKGR